MRHLILSALISVSSFMFLRAEPNSNQLIQHLSKVNAEWLKQTDGTQAIEACPVTEAKTFTDWIATHLRLVEQTLRKREVSHLSFSQKMNRLRLLDELNDYWHTRVFPINDYLPYKNPVFIDRVGTHCAVGYLMKQSGAEELAQKINNEQKFAYIGEIKVEGVKAWADKNGFSIDELAWIQPGYPVQSDAQDMDGGLNGTVNIITADPSSQIIYVAGSFSQSVSGVSCQNVAAWINGFAGWDWMSLGTGVNGTVHTLLLHNNKLYAGGEFTVANGLTANHIAAYDITSGQWQALGSLDSTVRALAIYNNELYAAGDFTGYVSKWNGSSWLDVTQGFLYGGGARTLETWNNMLVIGGDFELATGALRRHVATFDGSQMGILDMGITTPVNDLVEHNGKLYAACDVIKGNDTCALAVYENSQWEVVLKPFGGISDAFEGSKIKSLCSVGSRLYAAGDFMCSWNMIYGNDLMSITDTASKVYKPLASTDEQVNHIAVVNNILYFGGSFIANNIADTLNRIGYLELDPVGVDKITQGIEGLQIFPNPASDLTRVQSGNEDKLEIVELYDLSGRKIISEQINASSKEIALQHLSAGIYTIRALTKSGWNHMRLVKE